MTEFWKEQDAKARFSELLDASLKEGPQIVTRHGVEVAVLLPIDQWRDLERKARPDLKELLLAASPRVEKLVPPQRTRRHRHPEAYD